VKICEKAAQQQREMDTIVSVRAKEQTREMTDRDARLHGEQGNKVREIHICIRDNRIAILLHREEK